MGVHIFGIYTVCTTYFRLRWSKKVRRSRCHGELVTLSSIAKSSSGGVLFQDRF